MIKKTVRILLCIVSFFSFSLVAISSFLFFPKNTFYQEATASGLGMYPKKIITNLTDRPPYTYINLPRGNDYPAALRFYDTLAKENITEGQDPPIAPDTDKKEPDSLPSGYFPVIPIDMSENQAPNNIIFRNESKYTPDINSLAHSEYPLKYTKTVSTNNEASPVVLIIHTHGTECYLPDGVSSYTNDTPTRSNNTDINVVSVGQVLAKELNDKGIPTIHCETMFDAVSYSDSYDLSEKQIIEYLKQYPSIQYVFDVHRDSIVRENNEKIKPLTSVNGENSAQAMFVVGTNSSGADHPNWINNLTVASIFQSKIIQKYGNLMRPINLRAASFNAEHAPGSILIEVGTCGNTVTEAKKCASLLGSAIAEIILSDGK